MQGLTEKNKRTVPSARAVYPLNIYVVVENIENIKKGLYKMNIPEYKLELKKEGDFSKEFSQKCIGQGSATKAQVKIIITGELKKLSKKNSNTEGMPWAMFEAGAASQNGYLMAAAIKMKCTPIGGFNIKETADFLNIDTDNETVLFINCFGK